MGCSGGKMLDKDIIEDILNNRYRVKEMNSDGDKVGSARVSVTDEEMVIHHDGKEDPQRVDIRDVHSHGVNGQIVVVRTGLRHREYDTENGMTFIWKSSRAEDLHDSIRQSVQTDFLQHRHRFTCSAVQHTTTTSDTASQHNNSHLQKVTQLNVDEQMSPVDLCNVECLPYGELVWDEKTTCGSITTGLEMTTDKKRSTTRPTTVVRENNLTGYNVHSCQYSDIDYNKTLGLARTVEQRSK